MGHEALSHQILSVQPPQPVGAEDREPAPLFGLFPGLFAFFRAPGEFQEVPTPSPLEGLGQLGVAGELRRQDLQEEPALALGGPQVGGGGEAGDAEEPLTWPGAGL